MEATFEENLKKLEEIVAGLENGEVSLEESVRLFKDGVKLTGYLQEQLKNAEGQVKILTEGNTFTDFEGEV